MRYVDDCVIVHEEKDYLKMLVPELRKFLSEKLYLTLHPKKIYLQKASHGVEFLGAFIKPSHTVIGRRTKGNFVKKLQVYEKMAEDHKPTKEEKDAILSSVNSALQKQEIPRKGNFALFQKKTQKSFFIQNGRA